jgi:hypothetical protein
MQKGKGLAVVQEAHFGKTRSLLAAEDPAGLEPLDEEIALLTQRIANMEALVRDLSEAT